MLNKYHLTLILDRMAKKGRMPRYEDAWPWAGTFVALLLSLLPADFRDFLGIGAAVWQAIAIILAFATFGWTVVLLMKAYCSHKERDKTPEQVVEEVIQQMAKDNKGVASNALSTAQPSVGMAEPQP